MSEDPSLKQRLREFVIKNFYVTEAIDDDVSLLEKGIIDSTGVLEVVGFLESTFHVKVDDDEMLPENLDSISRIAAFVGRKKAA